MCFVFQVIRIWKEEDLLLDKAFKATVSGNIAVQLCSLLEFMVSLCLVCFLVFCLRIQIKYPKTHSGNPSSQILVCAATDLDRYRC